MNTDPLLKNTLYMYVIISKYHNEVWGKKIWLIQYSVFNLSFKYFYLLS